MRQVRSQEECFEHLGVTSDPLVATPTESLVFPTTQAGFGESAGNCGGYPFGAPMCSIKKGGSAYLIWNGCPGAADQIEPLAPSSKWGVCVNE